jgi:TatD DNase family protein
LLVDSHCHLQDEQFREDLDEVLDRARAKGVGLILTAGTDLETSQAAVALAEQHPDIYAAVGISPHDAAKCTGDWVDQLRSLATSSDKVVAFGETGLDFFRSKVSHEVQEEAFIQQIKLAWELDLAVIVHCRSADERVLQILQDHAGSEQLRVIMHCFSGDEYLARGVLAMNYYISFAANLTYPKSRPTRRAAELVPEDRMLIETDAPYLPPQSARGKRCEPSMIGETADRLANTRKLSRRDIERITERNFRIAFGLPIGKKDVLFYPMREKLYVSLTNRCPNKCGFCPRSRERYVIFGYDLQLNREAPGEEYVRALETFEGFEELVFCGSGEPTVRMAELRAVAEAARRKGYKKIRLDTNGLGSLINGHKIAGDLAGLVDEVWVSLNAPDAKVYARLCKSAFGDKAYGAVLEFARDCKAAGLKVVLTAVNVPGVDIEGCLKAAKRLGMDFRSRKYEKLG